MYDLEEFLQCAIMNRPIVLVTGGIDNPQKKITCVNEIDGTGKKFTCWDIQNGKLVLFIDEDKS